MTNQHRFFFCKNCGNLIGLIRSSGVPIVCCGEKMQELEANSGEGSPEKHLPVADRQGNNVSVKVGSVPHPAGEEHHIAWVYLQTEKGGQRKAMPFDREPETSFCVADDDKPVAVYAYCNLHGLWKTDL